MISLASSALYNGCATAEQAVDAMLGMSAGLHAGALRECEEALAADPDDRVAANNCAVCKMYCCNLPGAIQVRSRPCAHGMHAPEHKAMHDAIAQPARV